MRQLLATTTETQEAPPDPARDALIDIAYDCPTIKAAQRRAREGLANLKGSST